MLYMCLVSGNASPNPKSPFYSLWGEGGEGEMRVIAVTLLPFSAFSPSSLSSFSTSPQGAAPLLAPPP